MAKVWFSRGDELRDPICRIDERSEDIPTVGAARPLSRPSEAYRLVFDRQLAKQSARQPVADELPHWLDPESSSAVPWSAEGSPAQAVPRWLPKDPDTVLLTPLWMQQTMLHIPADWRDRLDSPDDDIELTPLDPEEREPPALVNRDARQRIPHPFASATPAIDIAIDGRSLEPPARRGFGKRPAARQKPQKGTGVLMVMLLNVSLVVCLLGVVTAVVAPEAMQRLDTRAVLACLSLEPSCALWSKPLPAATGD